ncbi:MAG TPA: UvrD-helicase domain-containing protein, partial [Verrucomicrobiae bacterium]|nr:UvrD-helicase domain-containing protein [Verrucomicrobiae bacterium]
MKIYSGSMGTGKTTRLLAAYQELIATGAKTGEILVLAMNATAVSDWRKRLNLPASGNINVYTYFGFVQREITRLWPRVESNLPGGSLTLEPVFMTTETSHYLMGLLVDRCRGEGYLPSVRATTQQIAIQLIDNLNTMAINNLSFAEAKLRFQHLAEGNREKELTFTQAAELMTEFRQNCLEARCLDYSLCVDLYNRYLLSDPAYGDALGFKYLLVDNLEESVPAAQDLIKGILPRVSKAYLGFDPTGGRTSYFGADPASAAKEILSLGKIEELTEHFSSSREIQRFALVLAQRITGRGPDVDLDGGVIKGQISTQFRGEMLQQVAQA